jgi:predicted AAA+ superfamily ATPase
MIAHSHGQLWNAVKIASSLGVSAPTVRRYLDILQDTFMLRQLQPYHPNVKKRLVKSSKVYLRDSGLLHGLLRLETFDDLLGHPIVGASWEGFVLEQIAASLPQASSLYFYRTSAGAEIDAVVERGGRKPPLAMEIKYSSDPSPSRGFWSALEDLKGAEAFVVCPTREKFPIGKQVFAVPIEELPRILG